MLKKTMTYTNLDGVVVTEDFYFNMTKAELIKMAVKEGAGFQDYLTKIVEADDRNEIIEIFEKMVGMSYGEKIDGRFIKKPEFFEAFKSTEAYSDFFYEILTDSQKAAAFVNGVLPKDLLDEASTDLPVQTHQNVFETHKEEPAEVDGQTGPDDPEQLTDDDLLYRLGLDEPVEVTVTNGFTDDQIREMSKATLRRQPRAVLN